MKWRGLQSTSTALVVVLLLATVLSITLLYILAFKKFAYFNTGSPDLGIYARHLWALLHGESTNSILGNKWVFSSHWIPVLYPMAWLTAIFPPVPLMLFTQAFCSGVIALVVFFAAVKRVAPLLAAALAVAALLNPAVHNANIFEFHTTTMTALFFALFLWAWQSQLHRTATAMLLIAITMREEAAGVLLLWGVYTAYFGVAGRSSKEARWQGAVYVLIALIWVAFAIWLKSTSPIIWQFFTETVPTHQAYSWQLIAGKATGLTIMLASFAFLPLFNMRLLAWGGLILAYLLFSPHSNLARIEFQYWVLMVPFFAFAAIDGLARDWTVGRLRFSVRSKAAVVLVAAVSISYGFSLLPWARLGDPVTYRDNAYAKEARQIVAQIKAEESVATPDPLLAHVASRQWVFRGLNFGPDVLILEKRPPRLPSTSPEAYRANLDQRNRLVRYFIEQGTYALFFNGDYLVAMRRSGPLAPRPNF